MFFIQRILFFSLLISISLSLFATDKDASLLKKAWTEYGFQEYSRANKLFRKAEKAAENNDDLCQALTGQAFCLQFGQKNGVSAEDYKNAVLLYERCIATAGENHKYRIFWDSMKAECLYRISAMNSEPEKLKQADQLWSEIQKKGEGTVFAQDSMLSRAVLQTSDFSDEKITGFTSDLENYLKSNSLKASPSPKDLPPNMILSAIMANYVSNVYFWRGDYKKSVDFLIEYCKLGPTSFQYKATAYFRIARISEMKLKDLKTAVEYYNKLYNEARSDNRAYYSYEKAKILSAQIGAGDRK